MLVPAEYIISAVSMTQHRHTWLLCSQIQDYISFICSDASYVVLSHDPDALKIIAIFPRPYIKLQYHFSSSLSYIVKFSE